MRHADTTDGLLQSELQPLDRYRHTRDPSLYKDFEDFDEIERTGWYDLYEVLIFVDGRSQPSRNASSAVGMSRGSISSSWSRPRPPTTARFVQTVSRKGRAITNSPGGDNDNEDDTGGR